MFSVSPTTADRTPQLRPSDPLAELLAEQFDAQRLYLATMKAARLERRALTVRAFPDEASN